MEEYLLLKWGTLKGWNVESDIAMAALRKYADQGMSASVMSQSDTLEQKQNICDLIDAIDGEIHNDWSGEIMNKSSAKKYVLEYGNTQPIR